VIDVLDLTVTNKTGFLEPSIESIANFHRHLQLDCIYLDFRVNRLCLRGFWLRRSLSPSTDTYFPAKDRINNSKLKSPLLVAVLAVLLHGCRGPRTALPDSGVSDFRDSKNL
jgi:hypothetical protein